VTISEQAISDAQPALILSSTELPRTLLILSGYFIRGWISCVIYSIHAYVRGGLLPADWAGDVEEPMMDFGERKD
jgi:hypothetical protein